MESFHGLVTWVEHDPAMRMQRFATRLALAVRLTQVDLSDLVSLALSQQWGCLRMSQHLAPLGLRMGSHVAQMFVCE